MATPRLYGGGTITPVAPVAAIPTTAAHLALFNGEQAGGKSYLITSVGFTSIVSAGAAFVGQLLATNAPVGGQAPITGTAASGPLPLDGQPGGSLATVKSAVTIVNNGFWHAVGMSVNGGAATATISMGSYQLVRGLYVVPPGGIFSLAVLCSAAGSATCDCFVTWEEA